MIHLIESKGFAETVNDFPSLPLPLAARRLAEKLTKKKKTGTMNRNPNMHKWLQRLMGFRDGRLDSSLVVDSCGAAG